MKTKVWPVEIVVVRRGVIRSAKRVLVCAKTNGHINGRIGPENVFETFLAIDVTMGPSY